MVPLCAEASLGHSSRAARIGSSHSRAVGHTQRVHLRIDATGTKSKAEPHGRARRTPGPASPDADMDRDPTKRRIAQPADRLLAVHPLRTADALQLGAAIPLCQGLTTEQSVVAFDQRLCEVSYREGFTLLPDQL